MLAPFRAPFSTPFPSVTAAAGPWYLSGGIASGNCIAAYQPKAAASRAASLLNLANGLHNITDDLGVMWDATNGWGFAALETLATDIVPSGTQANNSMIVRYSGAVADAANYNYLAGIIQTGSRFFGLAANNVPSGGVNLFANGGFVSVASSATNGVLAVAGSGGYFNGSPVGSAIGAWSSAPTLPILIGGLNGATLLTVANIQAIAIYSVTLSGSQVAAVTTAMNLL